MEVIKYERSLDTISPRATSPIRTVRIAPVGPRPHSWNMKKLVAPPTTKPGPARIHGVFDKLGRTVAMSKNPIAIWVVRTVAIGIACRIGTSRYKQPTANSASHTSSEVLTEVG
jgi:hypothetical protein